jgi:hypothetical protein
VVALNVSGYDAPDVIALGIILHGTFYLFIAIMAFAALLGWLVVRKT